MFQFAPSSSWVRARECRRLSSKSAAAADVYSFMPVGICNNLELYNLFHIPLSALLKGPRRSDPIA